MLGVVGNVVAVVEEESVDRLEGVGTLVATNAKASKTHLVKMLSIKINKNQIYVLQLDMFGHR